ncbi:MAG: CRISPR-associated endonuclease Cas1 [Cyanobacteria bacterium CRU_2_1]|nr:CRISPR-associated endonuclease Cas1 [Cyanobacteria bacterium CRU_2_1]
MAHHSRLRSAIFDRPALQAAWDRVRRNQGCAGVDGETIARFAQQSDLYLAQLEASLVNKTYRPMPLRQLFVPKKDGTWRTLGVPTVRDRIVQQALLNALHPVLDPQFETCSFAYRPGRSHIAAVQQVAAWRDRGYEWVLDADIVRYFDNIQHSRLFAEFAERVQPDDLIAAQRLFSLQSSIFFLIEAWVSSGILTREGIVFPDKGVPQGAVVSPILANLYLDDFDEIMMAAGLKLVRYGDDFVVLAKSQQRVVQAEQEVADLLETMGLQLHPDKTQITNFDRGFRFLGHVFAGSLVIPAKPPKPKPLPAAEPEPTDRLIYVDPTVNPTQMQQAMVSALKASHQPIPPPLYVVLGYQVRQWKPITIESQEWEWKVGMTTLYLVQQGTMLKKEQGRFVVETQAETDQSPTDKLEIPIAEVERILVFGRVQLSTATMTVCLEHQIPVIFLSQLGDYKGHLWSAALGDLEAEAAQFRQREQNAFRLEVARAIVLGKLANSKQLLVRLNRKQDLPEVLTAINGLLQDMEAVADTNRCTTREQLMGYEGVAAARYFAALGKLIRNPGFSFTERTRRPPKDPMNSLLSFGYTLLFNNVLSLILAEGLNPYLGNLHGSDRKEAFLAFDLVEEFRSPIVDTLVMQLVNQKTLKPTDFTWFTAEGGVYLVEPARRVFLKQFEQRMTQTLVHPDAAEPISYRRVIQLQVRRYKRTLLEGGVYQPFRRTN